MWVRSAIEKGHYRFVSTDHTYPKRIWYRDPGRQYWHGLCINTDIGTYKGWPVTRKEHDEVFR